MMSVHTINGGVTAPQGFEASGLHCGIRKNQSKRDLALIFSPHPCQAAAVYTQNLVQGAPITVTKKNLANAQAQAVLCNSGNANTCNADGEQKAQQMCEIIAKELGISPEDVIVASTGVIGQVLPIEPIANAAPRLVAELSPSGSHDAAQAIMTTDTVPKETALEFQLSGKTVRVGGIAKGSGMIHPNMATMLAFLTTDASIAPALLDQALREAVAESFNMVSIDGDTSTNDMVSILASGQAGNPTITQANDDYHVFANALTQLCITLARMMAKDGEGATKLLECNVSGAPSKEQARTIAKTVVCSSLLKAAMFGSDANWGRVLCAIGYAGADINIHLVEVAFVSAAGRIAVCQNGAGIPFDEDLAKTILSESEIAIEVCLHQGDAGAVAFGCDLTYDYVKINGDYRS